MSYATVTSFPCWYGKYELIRRLGTGGMAEVFLARLPGPEGFERMVVIKRILPALAHDPRMEESFIAEATLAAQVQHENIVQVFELLRLESGELFMSMEYVEGTDMAHLIRSANKKKLRIPPWFSVKCIIEVLDGLTYAHELRDKHGRARNLVHRDVTPSNIFISKQGAVKLADFGVAKDDTRTSKTLRGELKGKLAYMSPEQVRRQPIDRRTDVFAVGVVLWELLTQRRLFGGAKKPEIDTMNMICTGLRVPPSVHRRDVHPELDRCVLRALQIDPEARYQDARGFHKQLSDVLEAMHSTELATPAELVDILVGTKPAPAWLVLDSGSAPPDPGDYTRTDSADHSTEIDGSLPESGLIQADSIERPHVSRSYSGEFPFWIREGGAVFGPRNYWDVLDRLKRSAHPSPEISLDGTVWISLADYARLTGQQGIFCARKLGGAGEGRVPLNMLAALANLANTRANGVLEIDFATGTADVHMSNGAIAEVITTHPQLQTPEILIRESIFTAAQLPSVIHQVLADKRMIEDTASSEGWHDAAHLRARAIRFRLAAVLNEFAEMRFRRGDDGDARIAIATLPLLPVIVHEAMSARSLRVLLERRMKMRLVPTRRLQPALAEMLLSREELAALEQLIEAGSIEGWIAHNPEYEMSYLYLAHLLLETNLLEEHES